MSRSLTSLAVASTGLVLLAACSTGPAGGEETGGAADAGSTAGGEPAGDQFPVTIEHAHGETTIEEDPQRVATVGWVDHDVVAALGELPVGATKITWGGNQQGSTDWFDEAVAEQGGDPADITRYDDSDGIPVDEIAAVQPDLIIGTNSGMTAEEYERLSKIAPTVAYPEVAWGTPWRESLEIVGEALGRTAEAEQVLADTEAAIETARDEHPDLEGRTAAWTWFTPGDLSSIGLYTSQDLRPQISREFGMEDAGIVTELSEGNDSFSATLSAERADELDADLVFFWTEDEGQAEQITSDTLLQQVPAFERGSYTVLTDQALVTAITSPTPLSIPVVIDQFLPQASEAAGQLEEGAGR